MFSLKLFLLRDFGICTPDFSLAVMINWHLNYKGPKCIDMQDGTFLLKEGQDPDQDPLVIANHLIGQDLDHNPVVLVIDQNNDQQFLLDEFMQAGQDFETGAEFYLGSSPILWQNMTNH